MQAPSSPEASALAFPGLQRWHRKSAFKNALACCVFLVRLASLGTTCERLLHAPHCNTSTHPLSASAGARIRFPDNHWAIGLARAGDHIHRKGGCLEGCAAGGEVEGGAQPCSDTHDSGPSQVAAPWTLSPPRGV